MQITTEGFIPSADYPALGKSIEVGTVFYGRRNSRTADRELWLRTPDATCNLHTNEFQWVWKATSFYDYEEVDATITVRKKAA